MIDVYHYAYYIHIWLLDKNIYYYELRKYEKSYINQKENKIN